MLGNIRKWGPCYEHSLYFLYVTGFSKGVEFKNEWLGICWNAAFKGKHSRLLHTRITARQRQNLAGDYISILKCGILPTVSILESKKLQVQVFLLVVLFVFQGRACQTYQRCYRMICWQRSTGCTSQCRVINKSLLGCSSAGLSRIRPTRSTPSATFFQISLTLQTELHSFFCTSMHI